MKKSAAISIQTKNCTIMCTDMSEYYKWVKHFKKTKQPILSESLTIIDDAETLEELTK